jgi:DNA-binding response OmpR family regulator
MQTVLIVEDDPRLGPTIRKGLSEQGFDAILAATGQGGLAACREHPPALVVLDLGLPDGDGMDWLRTFRGQGGDAPVLILTARDLLTDKVRGLDAGADDYLVKPFAFDELVARLRALLRRASTPARTVRAGHLDIDVASRRVRVGAGIIDLTPREFDLIVYLAQRAGQVVSREMLAEHVWREPSRFTPLDNVIDVHVSRLRRKLTDGTGACPLRVVRGRGIVLEGAP